MADHSEYKYRDTRRPAVTKTPPAKRRRTVPLKWHDPETEVFLTALECGYGDGGGWLK